MQQAAQQLDGLVDPRESRLDLMLAHRSKLAQASLSLPYFKQRARAPAASGDGQAEAARLRKQLAELSKDFQGLLKAHEKADGTLQDVQGKIRVLRQEVAQKDKALDLCRRTIDRLTAEKAQMEGGAAADKAYIRRLESRLLSVKDAVELQLKCSELKAQAEQAQQELRLAEARLAAAEDQAQRQQQEAAFLKRGVELAAEQLTKSAHAEVPGTLLMAVARAQEEGMTLSTQLADAKQQLAQMASALQHARAHLLEQQKTLEELQAEKSQAGGALAAVQEELQAERVGAAELRHMLAPLRQQVKELREVRDGLKQQLELERTATAAAEEKVAELEAARKRQAKTEAHLRDQLYRATATAQGKQLAAASPGAAERPPAPTPSRSLLAASRGRQQAATAAAAVGPGPKPVQRLRQQRQQQQMGRVSPAGAGRRAGSACAVAPQHTLFDARQQQQREQQERLEAHARALPADSLGSLLSPSFGNSEQRDSSMAGGASARGCGAAAVASAAPALQDGKLAQIYASALDEQIAAIEGDLAELSASCSPRKLQRLLLQGLARPQPAAPAAAAAGPEVPEQGPAQQGGLRFGDPPQQPALRQQQRRQQRRQQHLGAAAGRPHPAARAAEMGPSEPLSLRGQAEHMPVMQRQPQQQQQEQLLSPAKGLPAPSPSKLLQPGWLANQSQPTSPAIGAWRPNTAFEPAGGAEEAVVMQALQQPPQLPSLLPAWRPEVREKPPALTIPAEGARDRYGQPVEDELSPPDSGDSSGDSAAAAAGAQLGSVGTGGGGLRQGQRYSPAMLAETAAQQGGFPSLISPSLAEPVAAAAAGAAQQQEEHQGLVWHSNPLAASPSASAAGTQSQAGQATAAAGSGAQPSAPDTAAAPANSSAGSSACSAGGSRAQWQEEQATSVGPEASLAPEGSWDWQRGLSPQQPQGLQQRQQQAERPSSSSTPPPEKQQRGEEQQEEEWWADEFQTLMGSGEAAATSQAEQSGGSASAAAAAAGPGLRPGTAGSGGGAPCSSPSFRGQWSAPSGASSWLNNGMEPDIEQLEVNSHRKPPARPPSAGLGAAAAAARAGQGQLAAGRPQPTLATLLELATLDLEECL